MKCDNSMAYWHQLRALARAGGWDQMKETLSDNAHFGLGFHDTLAAAHYCAAEAGKADILDAMYAQGFTQTLEGAAETLENLAAHAMPRALPAIAYLVNQRYVAPEKMLNALAVRGDVETLKMLDGAGVNIFASSSVFFLAFFSAQAETMEFLFEKGAALYHPTNIKGLYGRKNEPGEEGLAAFRNLVDADQKAAKAALDACNGAPRTLADCRCLCRDEQGRFTTLLHLVARAGAFSRAVALSLAEDAVENPAPLQARDLLKRDVQGQTVLSILAARRELPLVLDAALWQRRPEEAALVADALRDLDAKEALDMNKLRAPAPSRRRNVFAP